MMHAIPNKWVEKIKAKKVPETAPSYAADPIAATEGISSRKPIKRFTIAARQTLVKTLRGIRK
jgi:hypothetical protein